MSPSLHPQGLKWVQQQEQKWNDLVGSKTTQLQALFKEHLDWFRQHNSTTSIIGTRRVLLDNDITAGTPMKRRRFDNQDHDDQQLVSPPINEVEPLHQSSNQNAPGFITEEQEDSTTVPPKDDTATDDLTTAENQPKLTLNSTDKFTDQSVETTTNATTAARETLLKRFNEEEKRHGRYGLRNRSLDTAKAIDTLSSPSKPVEDTELKRRKTIHTKSMADDINNLEPDGMEKRPLTNDTPTQPETVNSLSFILSSLHEQSRGLPEKQPAREHGQEEQIDDEVQLVTRSNRNNKSVLSEGGSLILAHDDQDNNKQNSFILANESSFLSRMFSFGRATGSNLETSQVSNDGNSILSSSDSPRRPTAEPPSSSRTSRLVCASPSKERPAPAKKSTRESLLLPYLPRQSIAPPTEPLTGSETPSEQSSSQVGHAPHIPKDLPVDKKQDQNTGDKHQVESEKVVVFPSWALQPELDQLLEEQSKVDADTIFGKMPPIQVSRFVKTGH